MKKQHLGIRITKEMQDDISETLQSFNNQRGLNINKTQWVEKLIQVGLEEYKNHPSSDHF